MKGPVLSNGGLNGDLVCAGRCAACGRWLYDGYEDVPIAYYETGTFGALPEDYQRMHHDWSWRSKWRPGICRECDKDHDHRESPSLWYRLRRWVLGTYLSGRYQCN